MAPTSEYSESPLQRWKKLLGVRIHDVLKPQGFRRRGFTWYRENEDTRWLVNLQSSRDSSSEYLIAYVNVAVQSKVLWSRMMPHCDMPLDVWTHHYWRRLEPDASGAWRIRSDTQAQRSAEEIASLLQSTGREFFDRYGTTELLYWFWREGTRGPDPCHERTSERVAYLKDLFEPALLSPSPVEARLLSSLDKPLGEHGFGRHDTLFIKDLRKSRLVVEVLSAPASLHAYNVLVSTGLQYGHAVHDACVDVARPLRPNELDVCMGLINRDAPPYRRDWLVSTEDEAVAAGTAIVEQLQQKVLPLFESIDTLPKLLRYYQDVFLPADTGYKPIYIAPHMEEVLRRMLDKG